MQRAPIPESFLQQIWSHRSEFLTTALQLLDGSALTVLNGGELNTNRGGPDFLNARIAIDGVAISGDIELHISPENWGDHGHDHDHRYGNVILHVTLFSDDDTGSAPKIPTLVLQEHLFASRELWEKLFAQLYSRSPELACYPHNLSVPMKLKRKVVEKFGEARLEELIDRVLLVSGIPTEKAMLERVYQLTMDALGYSQNRIPFRELSALLPLERLQFVRASGDATITQFEALFFGVAGLLPMPSAGLDIETSEYLLDLNAHWQSLQIILRLPETLAESDWAFFRLRPMNSAHRRLALAASMAAKYFSLPSWSFASDFFTDGPSIAQHESYWDRHTAFAEPLATGNQLLGEERRSAIWLNVVLPARIARLRTLPDTPDRRQERTDLESAWGNTRTRSSAKYLQILQQELLEGESVNSVRSEQGGLLLLRNFCRKQRCYECPIGDRLRQNGWSIR
jgi:hypothetical protein